MRRPDPPEVGHARAGIDVDWLLGGGQVLVQRRVLAELHEAEGERGAVDLRPSSVQHSPLHQNLPATTSMPARACPTALPPGGPVGAPDPRVSVRARKCIPTLFVPINP